MEHLTIELTHQFLNGQLDPPIQARWEKHLQTCERCRQLVEDERVFSHVLDLGDEAPPPGAPDPEQPSIGLGDIRQRTPAGRRRQYALVIGGLLADAALIVLLLLQFAVGAPEPDESASDLRVPAELQNQVAASLGALQTLERDPWLVDDYDTVKTLEILIASHSP